MLLHISSELTLKDVLIYLVILILYLYFQTRKRRKI